MKSESVHVLSLGASCCIGRDAASCAAAVRAGVGGLSDHPYIVDSEGEPVRVGRVAWCEPSLPVSRRACALFSEAVEQALVVLSSPPGRALRVAAVLALPAPRPGVTSTLALDIRSHCASAFRSSITAQFDYPMGHAGGHVALQEAMRLMHAEFDACLVAGVDSYLDPDALEWLERADRLHGSGLLNNAWGFIPGEGAGAVLLAPERSLRKLDVPSLAELAAVGTDTEVNRIGTDTVCLGVGLTSAFKQALSALAPGQLVSDVLSDMNGEPYRADEYGFATLRTGSRFAAPAHFLAPADCWGDVGAASVPMLSVLAVMAQQKGYASGRLALVCASSDDGTRGAALFRGPAAME